MKKIIIFILAILFLLTIYVFSKRYIYITKDPKKLYVTVKGHDYNWNKEFYDTFLKELFPNKKEIIVKKISNPDILLVSHFFENDDFLLHVDKNVPYISWSGERYPVKGYENGLYNLLSQTPKKEGDIWFPFMMSANFFQKEKLNKLKNNKPIDERKFNIAYIASNCKEHREGFFKLLNDKFKNRSVHALGKCSKNYDPSGEGLKGNHENVDDIYQDYIFAFAMENNKVEGYITEKIMNVFRGGAIPLYWGCSKSVEKFFNKGSYIDLSDFNSYDEAADYIYELSKDKKRLKEIKEIPIFKDERMMSDIPYYLQKEIKLKI